MPTYDSVPKFEAYILKLKMSGSGSCFRVSFLFLVWCALYSNTDSETSYTWKLVHLSDAGDAKIVADVGLAAARRPAVTTPCPLHGGRGDWRTVRPPLLAVRRPRRLLSQADQLSLTTLARMPRARLC